MNAPAEQPNPTSFLQWSAELEQWTGTVEDGPFRLELRAERRAPGLWCVLLRDLAGQAVMMREQLEVEVPEDSEATAIVERLQELGDTWKQDPSLVFHGWGKP